MTWWYKGKQLGRQDLDRNFEIKAVKGPREEGIKGSDLTVTPLKPSYYGVYQCKAENPYGRVARYYYTFTGLNLFCKQGLPTMRLHSRKRTSRRRYSRCSL